jgi:dsDNA-binding SOS-regulon protein
MSEIISSRQWRLVWEGGEVDTFETKEEAQAYYQLVPGTDTAEGVSAVLQSRTITVEISDWEKHLAVFTGPS